MQKILLTIEFSVLAGALISLFIRHQLKRTSKPAREARLRSSRPMAAQSDKRSPRVEKGAAHEAPGAQIEGAKSKSSSQPELRSWPNHRSSRGIRIERPNDIEAMNALVNCIVREKNLAPRKPSDARLNLILNAFIERRQVPASARQPLQRERASE